MAKTIYFCKTSTKIYNKFYVFIDNIEFVLYDIITKDEEVEIWRLTEIDLLL